MMDIIVLILVVVVMGAFGQIYMKKGLKNLGEFQLGELFSTRIFSVIFEKNVFFGVILYVMALFIWLVILSKTELSFAYPLIGLGYIVTAILAKIYFNENLTFIRLLGIFLIVGGVFLVIKS